MDAQVMEIAKQMDDVDMKWLIDEVGIEHGRCGHEMVN
jgi:hypothetical protein